MGFQRTLNVRLSSNCNIFLIINFIIIANTVDYQLCTRHYFNCSICSSTSVIITDIGELKQLAEEKSPFKLNPAMFIKESYK